MRIITSEEYSRKRQEIMEKIKAESDVAGQGIYNSRRSIKWNRTLIFKMYERDRRTGKRT